jgi:hypothetical protein
MEAATTHQATTSWPATRALSTTLVRAAALLRAFARHCRESRLPETRAGAGFSMLPHREQDRVLNQGYRPY